MIQQLSKTQFNPDYRKQKSAAFSLLGNSTAGETTRISLWNKEFEIYANANLSIYSAQTCNAKCLFCVEELRPASRGGELARQKTLEQNDEIYFANLESTLIELAPLMPSASVTGGEPSKDLRLPRILRMLQSHKMRKRTMTTNGSGLLDLIEGERVIDWLTGTKLCHLNISRAHVDHDRNAQLMRYTEGLSFEQLRLVVALARAAGIRVRLSCVLLQDEIDSPGRIIDYIEFARSIGVDNVIFRQLMKTDEETHALNYVVAYSNKQRVILENVLNQLSDDNRFEFQKQIIGYYYYVEVWKYRDVDVVFEEADLAALEATKCSMPGVIHELVFHPSAQLASTWQPWDGVLGPEKNG